MTTSKNKKKGHILPDGSGCFVATVPTKKKGKTKKGKRGKVCILDVAERARRRCMLYFKQGLECIEREDWNGAIEKFTMAIGVDPEFAEAYNKRGVAYAKRGELDQAIQNFTQAIQLNAKLVGPYYNRGCVYAKKGFFDCAIADFTKVVELKPDYAVTYYIRGNAYAKKGDYERAVADYHKALELESGNLVVQLRLITAENSMGQCGKMEG